MNEWNHLIILLGVTLFIVGMIFLIIDCTMIKKMLVIS
jgi:hypothetical protein